MNLFDRIHDKYGYLSDFIFITSLAFSAMAFLLIIVAMLVYIPHMVLAFPPIAGWMVWGVRQHKEEK